MAFTQTKTSFDSEAWLDDPQVLLCVWWDIHGVIHYKFMKPGETITADVYCQQLERLNQKLKTKSRELTRNNQVILQHDNARPHKAKTTTEKICQLKWEELSHLPYSPDLARSDYHLFRSLEHSLKDKCFRNATEVENHVRVYFESKPEEFYKRGIEKLEKLWEIVGSNKGNYIL